MMTELESGHVFRHRHHARNAATIHIPRRFGEDFTLPYFSKPDYRTAIAACAFITTVDTVWQWIDGQSASVFSREHGGILEDVARSFTVFKLLNRRFCKYELPTHFHTRSSCGTSGRPSARR